MPQDTNPKNKAIFDPTKNVLDLVAAAVLRQDDLREAESRHLKEMMELRAELQDKIDTLRERHITEMALAEKSRVDAIRQVDAQAVAIASERAGQQAAVLAAQVAASAEALRTLVATTTQQQNDRIASLEKTQYENKGSSADLPKSVDLLKQAMYKDEGRSGLSAPLQMLLAALAGGIVVSIIQTLLK